MPVSQDFLDYCLDQFAELPDLTFRRMFGGAGLYSEGLIFALVAEDRLFLRTDPQTVGAYQEQGAAVFDPMPEKGGGKMPYHELPPQILENPEAAVEWALEAVEASRRNQKPKKKPQARPRSN